VEPHQLPSKPGARRTAAAQGDRGYRVPAWDGLRGLAILAVLLNHFATGVEPDDRSLVEIGHWTAHGGGLLGVQLFFVLSGFLITEQLVREHERFSSVSLRSFYKRRIRRLMPALLFVCMGYGVFALVWEPKSLSAAAGSIVRALTYTGNLPFPLPHNEALVHTWSLAVEEQFYLAWPIVLVWLLRRRPALAVWSAVAAVLVTILTREVVPLVIDSGRAYWIQYNGFRWDALMAGALLALRPVRPPAWVGWLGMSAAVLIIVFTPDGTVPGWLFTLTTITCALVVATATRFSWLTNRGLVHIGLISYSLYLWHVPVLRLGMPMMVTVFLLLALSELSFWLIERPASRHLFRSANRSGTRITADT